MFLCITFGFIESASLCVYLWLKKEECFVAFREKREQTLRGQDVLPDDWTTTAQEIREMGRKESGVTSQMKKTVQET